MADDTVVRASRKERCVGWLQTPRISVYVMKALSAWGDRMWMFAVGLYLVKLSNVTLTLTAIYGLTGGVCVILLGALVGQWVDKNPRLKVARTSLVIQNSAVILCAIILCMVITYYQQILTIWPIHLANICFALVIGTAIISKLASIATKIAVEKDWVVVMCAGDKDKLSTMNASMRRIDLLCNILAPVLVGQIMTFISMVMGAVVIAAWNLVSLVLEYYLLWRIYSQHPALAIKGNQDGAKNRNRMGEKRIEEVPEAESLIEHIEGGGKSKPTDDNPPAGTEPSEKGSESSEKECETSEKGRESSKIETEASEKGNESSKIETEASEKGRESSRIETEASEKGSESNEKSKESLEKLNESPEGDNDIGALDRGSSIKQENKDIQKTTQIKPNKSLFELVFGRFISIYKGWRVYLRQTVLPAGIAFSCEFMTVLAFDNITSGYAYSQGLSESIIGILMACGAVTGIIGTFVFPVLRRRIGLEKTGLVAFVVFIGCLTLCVVSIWTEGSPFDPTFSKLPQNTTICNSVQSTSTPNPNIVSNLSSDAIVKRSVAVNYLSSEEISYLFSDSEYEFGPARFKYRVQRDASPVYLNESGSRPQPSTNCTDSAGAGRGLWMYTSIGLLMAGIVTARFGLWLSDLTITQVFQENVPETERGVVNGVQSSLNMLMDVFRYAMVVIAPHPETYGILVVISFASICTGAACFVYYTRKKQGYLFCKNGGRDNSLDKDVEAENTPHQDKTNSDL